MNKDIRINWNMGMELMPETFIQLENQLAEYRFLLRKVQASKQFGLIPGMPFKASVLVDGNGVTLNNMECHALLQHGGLVNDKHEESLNIHIPDNSASLYLAVWTGDNIREYEKDDVSLLANDCQFGLLPLEELPGKMPIAKVVRKDGVWKLQDDYVVPVISMQDSQTLIEAKNGIYQIVKQILAHGKFKRLRNHDMLRLLAEEMSCLDKEQGPRDFVVLCRRFVRLLTYAISNLPKELAEYNPYDIQLFLNDVRNILTKAYETLLNLDVEEQNEQIAKEKEIAEVEDDCPIL